MSNKEQIATILAALRLAYKYYQEFSNMPHFWEESPPPLGRQREKR